MIKRIQSDYESLFFCDFVSEKEALGLSKQTIDNYKQVYDLFRRQTGQKISQDSISKWVHMMIKGDMNPITINYYIGQLKVFAF